MSALKPANKTVLIIASVAVLGLLAGSGVTYLALKGPLRDPAGAVSKEGAPPNTIETRRVDSSPVAGTITPSELIAKASTYIDKEVKVRGLIVENSSNKSYVLVDQQAKDSRAVPLDTSQLKTDLKDFVAGSSDTNNKDINAGPSTVTVTVKLDGDKLTYVAKAIEK